MITLVHRHLPNVQSYSYLDKWDEGAFGHVSLSVWELDVLYICIMHLVIHVLHLVMGSSYIMFFSEGND